MSVKRNIRSISFKKKEKDLQDKFDNNGGSDYAKTAMRFYEEHKNKVFIIPDGLSTIQAVVNSTEQKKSIKKLIK